MPEADSTGRSVDGYQAPLFVAWQLTNRCEARCIACCEESGPGAQWHDELTRKEALSLARQIVDAGTPYVAFGGGEPLSVPHCWEIFQILSDGGVAIKIETNGSLIGAAEADRLAALDVQCIQISVDGPSAEIHAIGRPGSSFDQAVHALRLVNQRGLPAQLVFVPTRNNIDSMSATFDLAAALGCSAFVTGPLMRLGRAAQVWHDIACSDEQWQQAVHRLTAHAAGHGSSISLAIYPHDILREMELRLQSPQALLLIVPNGKVKLLNALPFAVSDLKLGSLPEAWQAYRHAWRTPEVKSFVAACRANPVLLQHANETWALGAAGQSGQAAHARVIASPVTFERRVPRCQ
jgi:MoaA/NifB/PqqE/SkfB family radical SAM enzyme